MILFPALATAQSDILEKNCRFVYDMSKGAMAARQTKDDMPHQMEVIAKLAAESAVPDEKETLRSIARTVVVRAYDKPMENSLEAKQRTTAAFANSEYGRCMQGRIFSERR